MYRCANSVLSHPLIFACFQTLEPEEVEVYIQEIEKEKEEEAEKKKQKK